MEIAGQYESISDNTGKPVELLTLLATAQKAVQEVALNRIDSVPLELFDERTKFALWWIDLHQRRQVAKSELRWQGLRSGLSLAELKTLVKQDKKGCRFVLSSQVSPVIDGKSAVIDIALAMAKAWKGGADDVAEVLVAAGREGDDEQLWATITFLIEKLAEADPDALAWTALVRARRPIESATHSAHETRTAESRPTQREDMQSRLF